MTATLERSSASQHVQSNRTRSSRLPSSTRSRRPIVVVGSLVLIFSSIALFTDIYSSANRKTAVLISTRPIEQGQQLTANDLGQVSLSISGGVSPIAVSDASSLSGKRAAVTIPAGSLLTAGDVTDAQPVVQGDAVVGMALKEGQLPSAGVTSGDEVMVVQTASAGSPLAAPSGGDGPSSGADDSTGVLVPEASVFDVELPPTDSTSDASQLVSIEVPSTSAAAVSTAAAADQVSLVLLPSIAPSSGSSIRGGRPPGKHRSPTAAGKPS
jgi:Chaperone for flagella basal body P-ring formation